jgi:hypothetical protein
MSVDLMLNLLNKFNKIILCEPFSKHNVTLFIEFNKFSNEPTQTQYSIFCILKIRTVCCKRNQFFNDVLKVRQTFSTSLSLCCVTQM